MAANTRGHARLLSPAHSVRFESTADENELVLNINRVQL
jgi:hypothetical protein